MYQICLISMLQSVLIEATTSPSLICGNTFQVIRPNPFLLSSVTYSHSILMDLFRKHTWSFCPCWEHTLAFCCYAGPDPRPLRPLSQPRVHHQRSSQADSTVQSPPFSYYCPQLTATHPAEEHFLLHLPPQHQVGIPMGHGQFHIYSLHTSRHPGLPHHNSMHQTDALEYCLASNSRKHTSAEKCIPGTFYIHGHAQAYIKKKREQGWKSLFELTPYNQWHFFKQLKIS